MNMEEIRNYARQKGVNPGRLKKTDLIRAIQTAEGSVPCYATMQRFHCTEGDCRWAVDCKNEKKFH
jgi:hypothetical protein